MASETVLACPGGMLPTGAGARRLLALVPDLLSDDVAAVWTSGHVRVRAAARDSAERHCNGDIALAARASRAGARRTPRALYALE